MANAHQKKLSARLAELEADIDRFKAKAAQADADTQMAIEKQLEHIKTKRDAVVERLERLEQSGRAAWEDVRAGAQRALDELGNALEHARTRF